MNQESKTASRSLVSQLFTVASLVLLLLILLASGAAYLVTQERESTQKVVMSKTSQLNSLQSQVSFLRSQVELYQQFGDKYKDLVRKGIVKKQDRVFWSDSLVQMQQSLVIPQFSFRFSPESTLTADQFNQVPVNQNIFFFSRLRLDMALQHAGDLLTILEAINARVSPLYLVENCETSMSDSIFQKQQLTAKFDPKQGNLKTQCSLIVFHSHKQQAI